VADLGSNEATFHCTMTAVKMLAIFINNYFVEKVEALVVFFSVYGFF
jgi:hypothetical protein